MRTLVAAAAFAATLVPTAALAETRDSTRRRARLADLEHTPVRAPARGFLPARVAPRDDRRRRRPGTTYPYGHGLTW